MADLTDRMETLLFVVEAQALLNSGELSEEESEDLEEALRNKKKTLEFIKTRIAPHSKPIGKAQATVAGQLGKTYKGKKFGKTYTQLYVGRK